MHGPLVRSRTFFAEGRLGCGFKSPHGNFRFFFLSSFFYPLAFYLLFSLLTLLASRDFCENVFLVVFFVLLASFCGYVCNYLYWSGLVCSVYGALGWDPCGVHSVCKVYEALGLDVCGIFTAFVAFMGHCAVRLARGSCFFMLCIGGCPRVWSIGAQASPSHEPLLSEHSARRPLWLGVGAHGWRARVCQPWGHNSV